MKNEQYKKQTRVGAVEDATINKTGVLKYPLKAIAIFIVFLIIAILVIVANNAWSLGLDTDVITALSGVIVWILKEVIQ